ncbi:hypothetical protein CBR_g61512 [Chara braunii]|uniref:Uncharacterized protein n=1 Tax=Chara braunii TaxID=69332 RepID=A0A388K8X5_CHABU|nr:hypothetical protein CBR_g61512 [Chara braunii]|eukprot:GBG66469.1 hypothetical protein CBR_g61512 [Chara braunii]
MQAMVAALPLTYRTKTIQVSNFVTGGARAASINHTSEACTTEGMPVAGQNDCGAFTITVKCTLAPAERSAVEERCRRGKDAWGGKRRGRDVGDDRGGENERVLLHPRTERRKGEWITDGDKTMRNIGGEDGGDEVRGGEVAETETGGAVVGETRRGDSASGNAGMVTDAMEECTETKGDKAAVVVTDAMEEHTKTKGDTTAVVAPDAMEKHTETKGDTAVAGRVAPAESIVEATKADEEEVANRKGAARITNGMERVTKTDEDTGAVDIGNEEEAVIGLTGADNEEGAVTGVVRGQCVDTRESG